MKRFILIFLFALATPAAEETPNAFLQFVKKRATALRALDRTPETLASVPVSLKRFAGLAAVSLRRFDMIEVLVTSFEIDKPQ